MVVDSLPASKFGLTLAIICIQIDRNSKLLDIIPINIKDKGKEHRGLNTIGSQISTIVAHFFMKWIVALPILLLPPSRN